MSFNEVIGRSLAGLECLSITECERRFNCRFTPDDSRPGQYWGTSSDPSIDLLDVRIGEQGGIVVVEFSDEVQLDLAAEVETLGPPEDLDVVSPPPSPASSPPWSRKWSVVHTIAGARISFGFEEVDGKTRLVSASRSFSTLGHAR